MLGRMIATAALGGTLALGGSTAAWAAPSGAKFNCADAPKALQRISTLEAKAQTWLTKAQGREAAAAKAGRTKLAGRIGRRITAVERREARATTLAHRIEAACPGSGTQATSPS